MKLICSWTVSLLALLLTVYCQTIPPLDITASIIDEHTVHFIVLTDDTSWGFTVGISDYACKSFDSSITYTGADCEIGFETAFNGSAVLKWTNISSGAGRSMKIDRVVFFSSLQNGPPGGYINQTFSLPFCTAVEAAADITFSGLSDLSVLMNLTLADNAEAGGFTYQVERWNQTQWAIETTGNSSSTNERVSISTYGALYRFTVQVEDACDGYTLSENETVVIYQAGLEVPSEDPVLLSITNGNYMCFLWRYTNANTQFNWVTVQLFQSSVATDTLRRQGITPCERLARDSQVLVKS
ncbi:uncharacterized protein LOC142337275 [Convolutriloba macropyga]|uniref:uncharacterized protein LOC142337275 n=1 Tax=Convolutriloba macropyga TaxID=536237 RepID=UPI003F526876